LWEKNDWVVNTRAMDGGLKRQQQAWRFFDEGSDVNHFSYFFNPDSRRRLAMRLALKAQPFEQTKGFDKLTQRSAEKINVAAARGGPLNRAAAKGTVFVLPGIMGSELTYQNKEVWLSHLALLRGGMRKLVADNLPPEVQPTGLMASDYKRLVEELSRNYRVIPFAYDWRHSVKEAGANLVRAVRGALADSEGKPIHLLAHSMGGLVGRSMIAHDGELWQELVKRQGRLIMLGTPNNGAHQIARMLLGEEKLLKMLALIDFKHGIAELLQILRAFPGVLDLLPEEYFNPAAWEQLNKPLKKEKQFPLPDETALENARKWRAELNSKATGPAQMVYVAGFAERTPLDLRRATDGVLEVTETTQGDGRVTYKLGQLDNVPTYFADVIHGDMADHPPLFPALSDLLEQGRTERLPRQPRRDRTGEAVTIVTRAEEIEPVYPTEEELRDAVSGGRSRLTVGAADSAYTVQVSVMHGHLRYAKYPVAVGHYTGDSIVSAEYILDKRLGGRLSARHSLNRYPGPKGTCAVITVEPDHQPPGALIIGLGEVGEIRANVVRQGITTAALEYALAVAERPARVGETGVRSAAFSSLMIGTYGGQALTVAESVEAILTGVVNANRILQAQKLWDKVRVDKVELVEIYEDVAIQAIHAAHRLRQKPPADFGDQVGIEVAPSLLDPKRGGRYQRPITQYANDWWRRIQIVGVNKQAAGAAIFQSFPELLRQLRANPAAGATLRSLIEKVLEESARVPAQRAYLIELINCLLEFEQAARKAEEDGLEFTVLTDRARAEGLMRATQRLWVDQLVRDSISQPVFNSSLAATLFELLVPDELKSQSENTLLVLDRDAAQYPWELLAERSQTDKPVVTQIGMLRQFKALDFRPNPIPARQPNALVVGDAADHGLPELFGAQEEGRRVAAALRPARFQVTELIKPKGLQVITELFAREYQIMHIAAHGIFDQGESQRQGVVLGPNQYLTSTEIVNLRAVPELVFINCCHLGQLDAQAPSDQRRLNTEYPHRLAASIAEELIKIGVKAVVAAGWAVDDAAALTFADEFYREMLSGARFGEAVLAARQQTFQLHSQTNTWGAYQCYGNPGFMLRTWPGRDGDGSANFYSRREYRDELKSIAEQPDAADPLSNRRWIELLNRLDESIPEGLRDGEVLADLGDAWREIGNFEKAIAAYRGAVQKADARASLRVVERLANLQSRFVESKWRLAETDPTDNIEWGPTQVQEAGQTLKKAVTWLTWLNTEFGETAERLSLLGRVQKSLALLATNLPDSQKKLQLASDWYQKASERCLAEGQPRDNYTTFNWLACRILLGEKAPVAAARKASRARKAVALPVQPDFLGVLEDCVTTARQKLAVKEDFWVRVAIPDALVLRCLYIGNLPDNKEQIIAAYQDAFGSGARPNEVDSALSQLDFLREMLGRKRGQAEVVKALLEIKARLLADVQSANG
jgi:pimeloyl-ACP methyl ester carboxylesterase